MEVLHPVHHLIPLPVLLVIKCDEHLSQQQAIQQYSSTLDGFGDPKHLGAAAAAAASIHDWSLANNCTIKVGLLRP